MKLLTIPVALLVAAGGLAVPGPATAGDPGFVDQYEELIPVGGGNGQPGTGGGNGGSGDGSAAQLPGSTLSELQSSVDPPVAKALESVATSPKLGAPQRAFADKSGPRLPPAADVDAAATSFPDAVATSVEAENPYLLAVLLGFLATTMAAAAAFAFRRRRASARQD